MAKHKNILYAKYFFVLSKIFSFKEIVILFLAVLGTRRIYGANTVAHAAKVIRRNLGLYTVK